MIGTLLRTAAGAASFTLGSLWPMRWPAFPVGFMDFDMFNDAADAHWARAKARCAERGRQSSAAETECPAPIVFADPSPAESPASDPAPQDPADAGQPTSSDVSEERPAPAVAEEAVAASPSLLVGSLGGASDSRARNPSGAGQPILTVGELQDAAYAVRRHIDDRILPHSEIGAEAWTHLAEKLEAAALSK